MIKNILVVAAASGVLAAAGCANARADDGEALQGVVELEERTVAFEVAGRVRTVGVERGERVQQGAVLAELDDSLQQAVRAARAAEAEAAAAQLALVLAGSRAEDVQATAAQLRAAKTGEAVLEKNLARQRRLAESGALPQAQSETLEVELSRARGERQALEQRLAALRKGARAHEIDAAKARAAAAENALGVEDERLARHAIEAADEGTVLDVHVKPGEVVAPGAPVVTLGDTRHPYVDVFVPQGAIAGVQVGARAEVRVDALPGVALPGAVENVARRTEFTPRFLFSPRERPTLVVRVRVRILDPEERLHAGVPAFVRLDRGAAAVAR